MDKNKRNWIDKLNRNSLACQITEQQNWIAGNGGDREGYRQHYNALEGTRWTADLRSATN